VDRHHNALALGEGIWLQPVPKGPDYKAVRRRGSISGGESRLRKVQAVGIVSNRVFNKELKEGTYKIVDRNIYYLRKEQELFLT
jgi:hypothetical protein